MKYFFSSIFLPLLLFFISCGEKKIDIRKDVFFPVKIGDLWGLVDSSGNLISQPVFSSMGNFYDGLSLVTKNGKASFINDSGKIIGDFQYLSATHFNEGLAFIVSLDHVITCIDSSLKPLFAISDIDHAEIFSCGLAAVHKNGKYGFIDKTGGLKIDFQFDVVTGFSEDIAAVGVYASNIDSLHVNWFYIDKNGKKLFEEVFSTALPFQNGKAAVQKDEKMFWIDKTSKKIFDSEFDECRSFYGRYATFRSVDKWGILRDDGKIILDPSYPFVGNFTENFFPFSLGPEAFGYLDTNGKIKIQPKYKVVSGFRNGFSYVLNHSKLGILSKNGIETCFDRFDSAPGYFGVMLGFIDTPLNSFVDIRISEENISQ